MSELRFAIPLLLLATGCGVNLLGLRTDGVMPKRGLEVGVLVAEGSLASPAPPAPGIAASWTAQPGESIALRGTGAVFALTSDFQNLGAYAEARVHLQLGDERRGDALNSQVILGTAASAGGGTVSWAVHGGYVASRTFAGRWRPYAGAVFNQTVADWWQSLAQEEHRRALMLGAGCSVSLTEDEKFRVFLEMNSDLHVGREGLEFQAPWLLASLAWRP